MIGQALQGEGGQMWAGGGGGGKGGGGEGGGEGGGGEGGKEGVEKQALMSTQHI